MCKLLAIIDIENEDNALEFSELAVKPMTAKDDDGLGVILMGDQGLGVERWLVPTDFPSPKILSPKLSKFSALLPARYNSEGETTQGNLYALGIHSRNATTPKCLANVHPFVREGIALIHNGVISNHKDFKKEVSTCDSEALLSLYLANGVKERFENVQKVCDEATGWYAFMVFDPAAKSLTIVKDDTTHLYLAHIPTVGIVFCTSDEIIKGVTGRMKLPQADIFEFPKDTAMRWVQGAAKIETLDILSAPIYTGFGWQEEKPGEEKSILDVSDGKVFCEHSIKKGTWCRECYQLMGADYPEYLAVFRGKK